jgi:hypothetical protein
MAPKGLRQFAVEVAAKQFTQADLDAAIAAERERCFRVAASYDASPLAHDPHAQHTAQMVAVSIARAIRNQEKP